MRRAVDRHFHQFIPFLTPVASSIYLLGAPYRIRTPADRRIQPLARCPTVGPRGQLSGTLRRGCDIPGRRTGVATNPDVPALYPPAPRVPDSDHPIRRHRAAPFHRRTGFAGHRTPVRRKESMIEHTFDVKRGFPHPLPVGPRERTYVCFWRHRRVDFATRRTYVRVRSGSLGGSRSGQGATGPSRPGGTAGRHKRRTTLAGHRRDGRKEHHREGRERLSTGEVSTWEN